MRETSDTVVGPRRLPKGVLSDTTPPKVHDMVKAIMDQDPNVSEEDALFCTAKDLAESMGWHIGGEKVTQISTTVPSSNHANFVPQVEQVLEIKQRLARTDQSPIA